MKTYYCTDRTCGADDCRNCYPMVEWTTTQHPIRWRPYFRMEPIADFQSRLNIRVAVLALRDERWAPCAVVTIEMGEVTKFVATDAMWPRRTAIERLAMWKFKASNPNAGITPAYPKGRW
jgi:hypothetical protein